MFDVFNGPGRQSLLQSCFGESSRCLRAKTLEAPDFAPGSHGQTAQTSPGNEQLRMTRDLNKMAVTGMS